MLAELPEGLTECVYVMVLCPRCGYLRVAIPEVPEDRFIPCQKCGRDAEFTVLALGATAKALPFWEQAGYYLPRVFAASNIAPH